MESKRCGMLTGTALLIFLVISLFSGCTGKEELLVAVTPKSSTPAAAPLLESSYGPLPPEVLLIFEESLLARANGFNARNLIASWKTSLYGAQIGRGIWDIKGKGQWLVREAGRSVQPLDEEARGLIKELEALKPAFTPNRTPPPAVTPSVKPGESISPAPPPKVTAPPARPSPVVTPPPTQPPTSTPVMPLPKSIPAVPDGWTIYINKSWKYSLYYPPGWSVNESNLENVELAGPDSNTKIVLKSSYLGKSLDQWVEEKLMSIKAALWDYQLVSRKESSRGALKGWLIAYTGRPSMSLWHEYRDLMVSDGEALFWVSAYSPRPVPEYMTALEIALQTFELAPQLVITPVPWWFTR